MESFREKMASNTLHGRESLPSVCIRVAGLDSINFWGTRSFPVLVFPLPWQVQSAGYGNLSPGHHCRSHVVWIHPVFFNPIPYIWSGPFFPHEDLDSFLTSRSGLWPRFLIFSKLTSTVLTQSCMNPFHKSLFLVVLATRFRCYQTPTVWSSPWVSHVFLAVASTHLSKNEHEDHEMQPVLIPYWMEAGWYHKLCPMWALHLEMSLKCEAHPDHLFVWSKPSNGDLIIKRVKEAADPGKLTICQEIRRVAARLVLLWTHSIDEVQQAGQWSSWTSFAEWYLALNVSDVPCVAMGMVKEWGHSPSSSSDAFSFESFSEDQTWRLSYMSIDGWRYVLRTLWPPLIFIHIVRTWTKTSWLWW